MLHLHTQAQRKISAVCLGLECVCFWFAEMTIFTVSVWYLNSLQQGKMISEQIRPLLNLRLNADSQNYHHYHQISRMTCNYTTPLTLGYDLYAICCMGISSQHALLDSDFHLRFLAQPVQLVLENVWGWYWKPIHCLGYSGQNYVGLTLA